jgi:ABC-type uncharacterized transport system substrate-binding protein
VNRRGFITLLGGAAAWPVIARGQKSMLVVGFLHPGAPNISPFRLEDFHRSLSDAGIVTGRDVTIEYRWAEGRYERLPALAADLVRRKVAVIAAIGPASPVAKAATTTIPIVFLHGVDPVQTGLVDTLNRPGGNITGVTSIGNELVVKRLELLHALMPYAKAVATLVNPTNQSTKLQVMNLQTAASAIGVQLHVLEATTDADLEVAFTRLSELRPIGLVIDNDAFFLGRAERLAALTARGAVPSIFQYRAFVAAGGLMSYGPSILESLRMMTSYISRVLKGEKPADLPVVQPTGVELMINLKTAKMLGLTVPIALLLRADEVIE